MKIVIVLAIVGVCSLLVRALVSLRSRLPKGARYLPGPKGEPSSAHSVLEGHVNLLLGKPFVGSQLGKGYFWFQFEDWAKQYGPIYQYKSFGKVNVVVSTEKIANDLLRERGNVYSSREQLPMASKLLSDNKKALFIPYNGE